MMSRVFMALKAPFKTKPPTKLGRWGVNDNSDIKSALANIDSCGDKLCGDVKSSKQVIDKYAKFKKDNIKEN